MEHSRGFTVIEVVVAILLLGIIGALFVLQKNDIESNTRDNQRKTAINAMHYALKEVYFKENDSYPQQISSSVLPSVEPNLFTDPNNILIGEQDSDYRYLPSGCEAAKCAGYELRTTLEKEADYIKFSDR